MVGLLVTGGGVTVTHLTLGTPPELLAGLAMLTGAGALYPLSRRIRLLPTLLALPGAWWVARVVELPGRDWVTWFLLAWIVVGAGAIAGLDRRFAATGYGPVLVTVSIAGMFATLPDTESILPIFGVALPMVLLAWPKPLAYLGALGVYPALGFLAWAIAEGGVGREGSIIGAAASLALLLIEPIARWAANGRSPFDVLEFGWRRTFGLALLQAGVVLMMARGAGLMRSAFAAAVIAVIVFVVMAVLLARVGWQINPPRAADASGEERVVGRAAT